MKVSAQYAAEHFDELASAADRGEEVEIARDSRPALILLPKPVTLPELAKRPRSEMFGIFKDQMWISPDFDAQWLNDEIAAESEDGPIFPTEQA